MEDWNKLNKKKINKKRILLVIIILISIIMLVMMYKDIIIKIQKSIAYTDKTIEIAKRSEDVVFSVEKMYVCSSANALEKSSSQQEKRFNIYQYSDIALSVKNNQENGLNNRNTVKELYIDNIEMETKIGHPSLAYVNWLEIEGATTAYTLYF